MEHFFPGVFHLVRGQIQGVPVKPDPAGIRALLQELGGGGTGEMLFVGDSDVDGNTPATTAACASAASPGAFRGRQELEAAGADHLADTPEELGRLYPGMSA